ncbi:uncharacterized protein P174DRAFT_421582 [Aspergillus novofumigatus IBT 16806]|uniref:Bactericidal permeability-increasing protein n=1 Tax=Aspergillus novofumigatus (strain IBT 16806) TaxID=1392255 RepID=A0A2I1C4G2_ASPN1|nr:uncharacterized protein P174DRAFT_421582 [Aspergillus novofumigatus IBT 16806]PKX92530.1 hypothetical protein P174DRAFT_421582 [Aspergillus novofumigatus IBT 16806]
MPSKTVNRPMDTKQKEKDINQKLQLFGIYQAFKNGKLPSNKQCDVALNSAITSKALSSPPKELSSEGQALVKDLRVVIDEAKKLILSKNEGQLLQDFIWEAQKIGTGEAPVQPDVPVSKESAQQDADRAVEGLKTLGTLMITNGEFRKLLNDAMIIARDMAGDVSQQAADRVRPSQEQLSQVDQPAEENVWHEKPDIPKEQLKSRFQKSKEEAGDVANTATQSATGGQDPATAKDVDVQAGVSSAAQKAKEKVPEDVSEKAKSRAQELKERTRSYMEQKMPKERREQVIWRLKKMVIEIQGHPDYQQAVGTLLSLAEKYGRHTRDISQQGAGTTKELRGNERIRSMETNLKTLIERFANSTSLDDFFDSLDKIYRDADRDPELRGWFKNMDTFIRKTLQEQGYIMQEDCDREWDRLYDHGRYLLRDRYKDHTDRILDEIRFIGDQFNQDPQNRAFRSALEKLFNDLGRDASGNVAFKKHLLEDIRDVILPSVFENVRYVPVPRIEVSDPMADVVVENLVIESDNLMPNVVEFGSDNYFRWGRKNISNKRDNKIMISVSGIQADLRDVSYYIKKKQGFPSITDKGVMDIFLGNEGFGFKIAASTAHKEDRQHFVKLDKVTVKIHDLDIKLRKSKHKILFAIFKPMLFNIVRPTLEKVLEKQIHDAFVKGDAFAFEVNQEVQRAKEATKQDPANAPNIYSRYMDAARAKLTEKKQKAQAIAQRDTKIQTVTTLHDSMFPDIKLPGAVSNKATEYTDLARKGERWESPIFSIGSASESKDIPKLASIQRKPHRTAESRLREKADGRPTEGADGRATQGGQVGADGHPKTGYPSRGFADEMDNAFSNGATNGATNGHTNGHQNRAATKITAEGLTVRGTPEAFNPQTA